MINCMLLREITALRAVGVFSKYPLLIAVSSKHPQEVWDAFFSLRIGVLGHPQSIRMGEGGEWKDAVRADLRSGRDIELKFQGVGAHPMDS